MKGKSYLIYLEHFTILSLSLYSITLSVLFYMPATLKCHLFITVLSTLRFIDLFPQAEAIIVIIRQVMPLSSFN